MIDPTALAKDFARNLWILEQQTAGLSHADSLLQTPYPVNCLNWTLGHLLANRGVLLDLVGAGRPLPPEATARYQAESDPIHEDGPGVLPLGDLMAALRDSQERIDTAFAGLDEAALQDDAGGEERPLWWRLHFLYFHDTYHTGQTELLRQVTGVGDKVI